jgi:hypothetical protein
MIYVDPERLLVGLIDDREGGEEGKRWHGIFLLIE